MLTGIEQDVEGSNDYHSRNSTLTEQARVAELSTQIRPLVLCARRSFHNLLGIVLFRSFNCVSNELYMRLYCRRDIRKRPIRPSWFGQAPYRQR